MSIRRICTRVVATAADTEMIQTAAERMEEYNVGSLIVVGGEGRPKGILTDRDVALRCVAKRYDQEHTPVGDLMTRPVHTVNLASPIESALNLMQEWGIRRLAVVDDDGILVGIVALDDVLELLMEEVESVGSILRKETPTV